MHRVGVLHTFRGKSSDSEEVALATVDAKFCLLRSETNGSKYFANAMEPERDSYL